MKYKNEYVSKGLLILIALTLFINPVAASATGNEQSSTVESTNESAEETLRSESVLLDESEEVISSQDTQESTESTTSSIDEQQGSEKEAKWEMISSITTETFWWDTVHNKNFRYNDDIPPGDAGDCVTNHTQGYMDLSETTKFEVGWRFINITFKGKVYSPGDRIYDDMFLDHPDTKELQKYLRYNFEPLLFNVGISYKGLPKEIAETLPKFDPNQVLSETMYTIPEAPKVEGYVSADYVLFPHPHIYIQVDIGSQVTVSGGTLTSGIYYVYEPKAEPQPVISYYLDTEGNPIADETSTIGEIDEEYATTAQTIPGYTLVKVEGNTSGKYTAAQQEVRYFYLKDSPDNFEGSYVDYAENTVTSINDIDRQLKIVKNANLSLVTYENNKLTSKVVGSTQQSNLVGTVHTVSKRIQTKNGRVYYMFAIDGKQYILHSDAFQALPTSSDFTQESDLDKYTNVSLDFLGNYLDKINSVNHTISLVNNYNVYDLLKTDGDAAIPPYTGTVASLGLQDSVYTVNQEFVSSNGIKYYKILVDGYSYFINAAAFIIETVQSMF